MRNRILFRLAVIGLLLFELAISGMVYFFDDGSLDQAWELLPGTVDLLAYFEGNFTIPAIAGVVVVFIIIASFVGVLLFRNWGRWLYLGSTLFIYPVSIFMGPTIYYGWESALWDTACMLNGALILSMFLPPVSAEFTKRSVLNHI